MPGSAILRSALVCLAIALLSTTAHAQLFRAYLASDGDDNNPCTLQAPCRLLPTALNAVASGGEIWMLDSANYNTGAVTIGKSVSILAVPGVVGSIVALNDGPAIGITASGLTISLRNVVIGPVAGATPGTHGVFMSGNSTLTIENSLIASLPNIGVVVSSAGVLKVINTLLRNNEWAIIVGNGASADISGSQMLRNTVGGVAVPGGAGSTRVSVSDSIITGPSEYGVLALTDTGIGGTAQISVTRSTISHTDRALVCDGLTSTIFTGNNLIAYNQYAFYKDCPAIYTAGNNQFNANAGSSGAMTPLPLQ